MARFLPDTSCIVAALCSWHEHHSAAAEALNRRIAQGEAMIVAAAALVETYAVLTRLPPPHRLSPADTFALLDANFMAGAESGALEIVALDATAYQALLRQAPLEGTAGGRIYDALIASCAAHAQVDSLLTFNERHFQPFASPSLQIVVPSASAA
ncbi:MAG: PIN domain-containing protein [Chloroflexota bacterium]|nr:PIN domain-containing protein [Chloroflexota bacterium]